MIDDLPDLDELETATRPPVQNYEGTELRGLTPEQEDRYIRRSHQPLNAPSYPTHPAPQTYAPPSSRNKTIDQVIEPMAMVDPMRMNCIDIAHHIQGCPICSKFYNTDKTLYVLTIVVLGLICLMLLKRVLEV